MTTKGRARRRVLGMLEPAGDPGDGNVWAFEFGMGWVVKSIENIMPERRQELVQLKKQRFIRKGKTKES